MESWRRQRIDAVNWRRNPQIRPQWRSSTQVVESQDLSSGRTLSSRTLSGETTDGRRVRSSVPTTASSLPPQALLANAVPPEVCKLPVLIPTSNARKPLKGIESEAVYIRAHPQRGRSND